MKRVLCAVKRGAQGVALSARITAPAGTRTLHARVAFFAYDRAGAPKEGESLSEETFFALFGEEEAEACTERACRILAVAPNSRRALTDKLLARGFAPDTVRVTVEKLSSRGYLDEADQLCRLVEIGMAKFFSRKKLMAALLRKGYRAPDAIAAMDKMGYDEKKVMRELLRTRLPKDASSDDRVALLRRYGFLYDDDI